MTKIFLFLLWLEKLFIRKRCIHTKTPGDPPLLNMRRIFEFSTAQEADFNKHLSVHECEQCGERAAAIKICVPMQIIM